MRNIILSVLFLFISSLAFAQNGGWNGGGSGSGSGTVSSGTTNQEAVYTGSTTVGSGNITDNGNVGIGSTNPGQALDVKGTVRVSGTIISSSNADDQVFNVRNYGALGNGIGNNALDGSVTATSTNFTSASGVFTVNDVGKVITIQGAGAAGVDLTTTIAAYVSATAITLTDAAGTTVTASAYTYGSDDTTAIQNAINAVGTNLGGTVFFPQGIYIINGSFNNAGTNNSQLALPAVSCNSATQSIVLKGAFWQSFGNIASSGNSPNFNTGSILYFTKNGSSGAQAGMSVFGTNCYSVGFSNLLVQLKDISFRTVTNPTHSVLNLSNAEMVTVDGVNIDTGIGQFAAAIQPTNATSIALNMPKINNHALNDINHTEIYGFYTCISGNEHMNIDNSGVYFCINGLSLGANNHGVYIKHLNAEDDVNVITITGSGAVYLSVEYLDIEHASSGWYQTTYDINDSGNHGIGSIGWSIFPTTVHNLTLNGATGFYLYPRIGSGLYSMGSSNDTGPSNELRLVHGSNNQNNFISFYTGTTPTRLSYLGHGSNTDTEFNIWEQSNSFMNFATNNVERMRVDANGNVGIGSTNPGSKLDVNGTLNIRLGISSGNVGIGTGLPSPGSSLTIGGKCLGLSGDMYLNASGQVCVCTAGTFPACSSSTCC